MVGQVAGGQRHRRPVQHAAVGEAVAGCQFKAVEAVDFPAVVQPVGLRSQLIAAQRALIG